MSGISTIGGSSNAWAAASSQRSQMQAKMFAKVDADSSGSVDKAELQTMLADVDKKQGTSTSGSAAELMTKFDSNSDGKLSSDELAKGMKDVLAPPSTMEFAQSRTSTQGSEDPSKALFTELDVNGNGSLDQTELKVQSDRVKAETGQDTSDAFGRMDSDGDGKLSATEFAAGAPPAKGGTAPTEQANGGPPPGGGPRGAGGPHGAGGASESSSSTSTTYDSLDTNQDGVVSEMERLVGELAQTASSSQSTDTSSSELAQFAQQLYEQVAASWSSQSAGNAIDALA